MVRFQNCAAWVSIRVVEFHPEISTAPPAQIKIKLPPLVGNERQAQPFVLANRPVPTAVRVGNSAGAASNDFKFLVRNSNDVKKQVVKRISTIPKKVPHFAFWPIPIRRNGIIDIAKPEKRIEFLASAWLEIGNVPSHNFADRIGQHNLGGRLHLFRGMLFNRAAAAKADCRHAADEEGAKWRGKMFTHEIEHVREQFTGFSH